MAIHFKTSKDRLDYLKGKHQEIIPVEVKDDEVIPVEVENEEITSVEVEPVEVGEEKPKTKSAPKKKAENEDGKVSSK